MIRKRPESTARSPGSAKSRKRKASAGKRQRQGDATAAETELEPEAVVAAEAEAEVTADEDAEVTPPADAQDSDESAGEATDEASDEETGEPSAKSKSRKKKEPVDVDQLALRLEALLFASGQALGTRRLSKALGVAAEDVHLGIEQLGKNWADRSSALELVEASGGWRLMTKAIFHEDVARLRAKTKLEKLSPAALETLAVVAYRQPIGRADIEAVRGVQCGPLLRVLLDRDLIRITGRSSEPGHPLLYGTSKRFLDHFGLASLKNLPDVKDLLNVS